MVFDDLTFSEKRQVVKDLIGLGYNVRYTCINKEFYTEDDVIADVEYAYEELARDIYYEKTESCSPLELMMFVDFNTYKDKVIEAAFDDGMNAEMFAPVGDFFIRL